MQYTVTKAKHMPQKILVTQPHLQAGVDTHMGPTVQGVFGPLWPAGSSSAEEARVCTVFNRCVSDADVLGFQGC